MSDLTTSSHQTPETPSSPLRSGNQENPSLPAPLRGNPPLFLTQLLGREQEVERVSALLQRPDIHILTLIGPGGVGKTRLGLAVATRLCGFFSDGACFVSLASIRDPQLVLPTIAQQLEVKETGGQPMLDLLIVALRDRHLLLLLDNLEQVVEAAPRLAELLVACPRLTILATSRAPLHLDGEHIFPVTPLALPNLQQLPAQEELAQQAAVALFLQRAQALQPDFRLTSATARTIAEICVRLDGLPLAIELAAARTRTLPPHALLARLTQRLSILTRGAVTLPARQQTLRSTLQWSYDLLEAHEQRLFQHLSIFVGGFTLEDVEGVCGAFWQESQGAAESVLDGVDSLLEKSLLYRLERPTGEPCFAMLETIREYGLECLANSGELARIQHVYTTYYQALAHEATLHFHSPEKGKWLDQLGQEQDNLRAVLNGLLTQGEVEHALHLCLDLFWFWWRDSPREGQTFLERALAAPGDVARDIRGWALQAMGILASNQGKHAQAEELWQKSLTLFQEVGGALGSAWALSNIGIVAMYQGEYRRARQVLENSLALFREQEGHGGEGFAQVGSLPVSGGLAFALFRLASVANLQGDYARARALAEESLPFFRAAGDSLRIPPVLEILASAALQQGDYASAQKILAEKLTIEREDGIKRDIGLTLALQGQLAFLQGETDRASTLLTESIAISQEAVSSWMPSQDHLAVALSVLGRVAVCQKDLARAHNLHQESLAAARHMAKPHIIAFSLEGLAETMVLYGKAARAVQLWGVAESLRQIAGTPLPAAWRPDYQRSVAAARASLGEQAFSSLRATGRTLSLEQVLTDREPAQFSPPASPIKSPLQSPAFTAGLTPREMDVLRLLAQGLTSAQIAEQLVVSLVTVNTHVRSIYSKLGVTSRAAATRYAIEHKLV